MDLDLFIDPALVRRTSASLFEQIRDAIATGRLSPGDRLPTSRDLAAELGVARSTIVTVYARLTGEGFLQARVGDGTFVSDHRHPTRRPRQLGPAALRPRRPAPVPDPPVAVPEIRSDLRPGRPDPRLFPVVDWRRSVTNAVQAPPPGYGNAAGLPVLRQVLAAWISRSRGVVASPEQILVTAGAQQAFDLIARVLLQPGDTIAIEEPGYAPARRVFEHQGLRVVPVPVDAEGIVVDGIPASARAVYVTPSHQSPTGVTMTAGRRRALLAHAAANRAAVIEDDYDTEFRHVDRPIEPIQRLDTSGCVLYVTTFSKSLSPSLRLGFAVVPEPLVDGLTAARALTDGQPPHLTQAALASFIADGSLDRHLRRARRTYRARHDVVARHVEELWRDGLIRRPNQSKAGLHAMISLLDGHDATSVVTHLATRGIAIDTVDDWWATDAQPGLMIGFGAADVAQLDTAFVAIREALRRDFSGR